MSRLGPAPHTRLLREQEVWNRPSGWRLNPLWGIRKTLDQRARDEDNFRRPGDADLLHVPDRDDARDAFGARGRQAAEPLLLPLRAMRLCDERAAGRRAINPA